MDAGETPVGKSVDVHGQMSVDVHGRWSMDASTHVRELSTDVHGRDVFYQ